MGIFNKKELNRIVELEKKIKILEADKKSLQSDVDILEEENTSLKSRLGIKKKTSSPVKSKPSISMVPKRSVNRVHVAEVKNRKSSRNYLNEYDEEQNLLSEENNRHLHINKADDLSSDNIE